MNPEDVSFCNYLNGTFSEIHEDLTNLYEAMADKDNKEVVRITSEVISHLRDIQKSHK